MPSIAEKRKLSDQELKAIIDSEIDLALGESSGDLSTERALALDRYLAEPMGTEMEGRSQVQTRDVMDTIEWILPSLIRLFTDSDKAVNIEPVGPEDEEQALQETDYLNWLFYKKNDGWLILYTWFKDALLSKNGITKHWVDRKEESTSEVYKNMTDVEWQAMNADDELEVVEHETHTETAIIPNPQTGQGEPQEITFHDAKFVRTTTNEHTTIEVMPPEEFLISRDARHINPKKARFCGHQTQMTISSLREMGFDDADILLMDIDTSEENTEEKNARYNHSEEYAERDPSILNQAMREVTMVEGYVYADMNGDGIAELIQFFRSGDFLDWEEADHHPFNAITPIIMTHKFYGISIADILRDIQEIRTELMRSYLDNIYQGINGRTYYDENTVNLEDLLTSKPWGLVGNDGPPGQSIFIDRSSGLDPTAYSLLDVLDKMASQRVGDVQAQLDPNVLAQANTGVVLRMLNEAKAKVEMIGRIFAETGVKQLFRDLHELARKNSNRDTVVKLRGNWIPVNPSEWRERTDFTVNVGLGTDTKQEKAANISSVIDKQLALAQIGHPSVQPNNVYETAKDYAESLGLRGDEYFTDPQLIPPAPPQPDPAMIQMQTLKEIEDTKSRVKMAEIQTKDQQSQREAQIKEQELIVKAQNDQAKLQLEGLKNEMASLKAAAEMQETSLSNTVKEQGMTFDQQMKAIEQRFKMEEAERNRALEQYKTELGAATSLADEATTNEAPSQKDVLLANLLDSIHEVRERLDKAQEERNAPREIEVDENGRIIGIGSKRVIRDGASGRPVRIE